MTPISAIPTLHSKIPNPTYSIKAMQPLTPKRISLHKCLSKGKRNPPYSTGSMTLSSLSFAHNISRNILKNHFQRSFSLRTISIRPITDSSLSKVNFLSSSYRLKATTKSIVEDRSLNKNQIPSHIPTITIAGMKRVQGPLSKSHKTFLSRLLNSTSK